MLSGIEIVKFFYSDHLKVTRLGSGSSQSRGPALYLPGRIKKRAAHSENFLGGLVCTRNLAFRLQ